MTLAYAYTPNIWPSLATVLLLLALTVYSWGRRSEPGALLFAISSMLAALWAVSSIMTYTAVDIATKVYWYKFEYAWPLFAVTAIDCFVLEYIWPGRWLTRRNLAGLSIVPLLSVVSILTSDIQHLAWLFLRSPQHRWPVTIIMTGEITAWTIFLLDEVHILNINLPLDIFQIGFLFLMYAIVLFGFRIFDPLPMAHQLAIEQLHAGILVLDPKDRIVSLNPAAERILCASARSVKGKPIHALLPAYPEGPHDRFGQIETELCLGSGHYSLVISLLKDFRGLEVGRLLLLHDVTEQDQAQEKILDQQRALATLRERERLARELHDDLAQNLALINLQSELVNGLMDVGQVEHAREQLLILSQAAREAQVEVRGEIYQLAYCITPEEGFPSALQRIAETFQQTNGILTDLVLSGDNTGVSISPTVELQLLRIVQEAFANIRKHSGTSHVKVVLTKVPGLNKFDCLQLMIEDDGIGFDPHSLPSSRETFGLGIMSERAVEVGGRLEVKSEPGKGTQVTVIVPILEQPVNVSAGPAGLLPMEAR